MLVFTTSTHYDYSPTGKGKISDRYRLTCPWCKDGLASSFEPSNDREYRLLCRSHQAEYEGLSLDGLDRMEAADNADMADLGYFD